MLDDIVETRKKYMDLIREKYGFEGLKMYELIYNALPSLKGDACHPNYNHMMMNKFKIAYAQSVIKLERLINDEK